METRRPSIQSNSAVKSVAHLNGSAVHTPSNPNMPATIADRASQKIAVDIHQKCDSAVSSGKCGVRPLSVHSTESAPTLNGHSVSHLPQSLPASKSRIPNGYDVPSASTTHVVSVGKKRQESNDGDRFLKQNKSCVDESCLTKTISDSCASKTLSHHKTHAQPSSGSALSAAECVERSPSKWNCCVNLHRKDRVKTGSQVHNEASDVGRVSHCKSVGDAVSVPPRKCDKKLSKTKSLSVSSTTNWRVTTYSGNDSSPGLCDKVHATTPWCVTEVVDRSSVPLASSVNNTSTDGQSYTSVSCNEAVRGGQERVVNGDSSTFNDGTGDVHRTSVRPAVNCTYRDHPSFTWDFVLKILLAFNFNNLLSFCYLYPKP